MFLCLLFLKENTDKGKPGRKRQLPLFAEFVMVLVRLRLGLLQRQIADIFCISQPSVSKIFTTWITMLYHVFKQVLVRWPSKQLVKRHLPKCFSKYPRTRVIIDCTELKAEKPSAPSSQKVTWSDYKSHNTFKLLVGITPSGAFSFVSDLYSGARSDRAITIRSGLIECVGKVVRHHTNVKNITKKNKITTIKIISTGLELLDKILGNLGLKDF